MREALPALVLGLILGFVVGGIFNRQLMGPSLWEVHKDFARCVTDGAPRDKCIEKYLLPTEQK